MLLDQGHAAGLVLRDERRIPFSLDFDEWLSRGSGGPAAAELIAAALLARSGGIDGFRVQMTPDGGRQLDLRYHISLWQRAP